MAAGFQAGMILTRRLVSAVSHVQLPEHGTDAMFNGNAPVVGPL